MKKSVALLGSVVVLSGAFTCLAAEDDSPYSSRKPLYALLVLDGEARKVLELVFDESGGTGKGYDTIHVDLDLNADPSNDKPVKGKLEKEGEFMACIFPPISVAASYNAKGEGVETPWQFTISYYQFTSKRLLGLLKGKLQRTFLLDGKIRLKDEAGEWEYSFRKELYPSEKREGTLAVAFDGDVALTLDAKPDEEKEGNIGIAAELTAGGTPFSCSRVNQYVSAQVQTKDEQGKVIHSDDVSLDKLSFGCGGTCGYSVRIPSGRHTVTVTVNTGVLAGFLKVRKVLVIR